MAQLRDSVIDGNLEVSGNVTFKAEYNVEKVVVFTELGSEEPDDMESTSGIFYTKYDITSDGYFVLSGVQASSSDSPLYSYIKGQTDNATSIYEKTFDDKYFYRLLTINDNLILDNSTFNNGIRGFHSKTGETSDMLRMDEDGNTVVGFDGYNNENGNSHIYGNDVYHYIASAGKVNYRPYYRAGDTIDFTGNKAVRTAGYLTNSNQNVVFTICLPKPIIGSPTVTVVSGQGFVLRQGNSYTHGSAASTFVTPTSYSAVLNPSGIVVTAVFDVTTNSTNNDSIGIYWDGTVTLS